MSLNKDKTNVSVTVGEILEEEGRATQPLKPVSINVQLKNEDFEVKNIEPQRTDDVIAYLADAWDLEEKDVTLTLEGKNSLFN